ncbi:MAG: A/G-specific adenine glycosylase [Dehalococcoidia bacterium]
MPPRLPPQADLPLLRQRLLAWHRRRAQEAPWRTSGDPYHVLVAAVMAQQTQMSRVLPKYDEFIAAFPAVEALARASTADVLRRWAPLGYNMRALRLHRAAQQVARAGAFPRTAAELQRIEGVGPFTAAIIASFAFGEPVAAIDTNVQRVVGRLLGDERLSGRTLQQAANALLARKASGRWNQAMMDLGATICTARSPRCESCPLARWCRSRRRFAARPAQRVAEAKAAYQPGTPFKGSRRYYRGRIVQALRDLRPGASLTPAQLLADLPERGSLDQRGLNELLAALERDGLIRRTPRNRLRLP